MTGVDFTASIRLEMLERDDFRCVRCGRWFPEGRGLDAHHRKLRSRGGLGTLENGISLCGSGTTGCHGWVHANPAESRDCGWMVSSWDDPAEIPWITWQDLDVTPAEHGEDGPHGSETPQPTRGWDVPASRPSDRLLRWEPPG